VRVSEALNSVKRTFFSGKTGWRSWLATAQSKTRSTRSSCNLPTVEALLQINSDQFRSLQIGSLDVLSIRVQHCGQFRMTPLLCGTKDAGQLLE
jgi:hypothetical protein